VRIGEVTAAAMPIQLTNHPQPFALNRKPRRQEACQFPVQLKFRALSRKFETRHAKPLYGRFRQYFQ
jgi:hypothetical protein